MLDILIKSAEENEIDDDGIREEVDTFVFEVSTYLSKKYDSSRFSSLIECNLNVFNFCQFASIQGHDTTAMAFIFTIALLAEHTEIQVIIPNEFSLSET